MQLVDNWQRIALRSHSMWAQYLALIVLLTPEALFLLLGYDVASPRLWWLAGVALSAYGVAGRLINQGLSR